MALQAVDHALNDPDQHCWCCLGYRRTQLGYEEHHRVLLASRAPEVEFMALGATLHTVDCHVSRAHSPLVIEPGGWRNKTVPVYLTRAETARWLSARGRKRCQMCGVATTRVDP